ncbi:MAG: nuclear transport factor 2 family protein [Paracoccaceae bacterium]
MDGQDPLEIAEAEVAAQARAYADALHRADTAALEAIFHPSSHLYASQDGALIEWPRAHFLARVGSRAPLDGATDVQIEAVHVAGPEMAHVTLSVAVPPRRYTDYLDFLKLDGEWRIIAKIFRVADGPAV